MSISKDNELDNYGVWVKHSANSEENMDLKTDDLDKLDDLSLDLPDFPETDTFDDTDFSDMFKDDNQFSSEKDSLDTIDTTLTNDELENITNTTAIESSIEDTTTDLDLDSISELGDIPEFDDSNFDINSELADLDTKIEVPQMDTEEEPNFESFDMAPSFETTTDSESSDDDFSFGEDEEISLDDFMDEGFSDESVAAGNNGYEPGKEPTAQKSNESEEVSLDDFMDFMEETPKEQTEDIVDEKPLEMDIAFDESAETVMTEDNLSVESYDMDDDYDDAEISDSNEDVSFVETTSSEISTAEFGESEEIDLSDFGIDANAEETAVTQDVEASKAKEVIVDYDLSVGEEDNLSSAPIVNEIKDKKEESGAAATVIPEGSSVVETSLLQQIVSDLSSLKDEIDNLKKNLSDINNSNNIAEQELDIPEQEETSGGFFDSDDTDDTIALSGDELNNIMNTADFTEETVESATEETFNTTSDSVTEITEPQIQEDVVETPEESEEVEVVENDEPEIEETFANPDGIELSNEIGTDEVILAMDREEDDVVVDTEEEITEENSFNDIGFDDVASDEDSLTPIEIDSLDDGITSSIDEEPEIDDPDLVMDFDDSTLTEPDDLDNLSSEIDEDDSDLPEEISIPKDEILVESSEDNYFETIARTDEDTSIETTFDEVDSDATTESEDSFADVESFASTEDEFEEQTEVPTVEAVIEKESLGELIHENNDDFESDDFESADNIIEEDNFEISENAVEEQTEDDTIVSSFEQTEEIEPTVEPQSENKDELNSDLKAEIKSVLLYMDQLLENLPEEKIMEFAKSNEFTTYKKLFSDLGLS